MDKNNKIVVALTYDEAIRVECCLMYISGKYQLKQFERERTCGQDNTWQELRDIHDYYAHLAKKFNVKQEV